jgi:hypothetical protein
MDPAISTEPVGAVTTRNTTRGYPWVYLSVAPSVDGMTLYEEIETPAQLRADCEAVNSQLVRAAQKVTEGAPSIHFDDFPREVAGQYLLARRNRRTGGRRPPFLHF